MSLSKPAREAFPFNLPYALQLLSGVGAGVGVLAASRLAPLFSADGVLSAAAARRAAAGKRRKESKGSVAVDGVFFKRFVALARIIVPGPLTKEAGCLYLVAVMMVVRTYCDVWMITNGTAIERSIISRSRSNFNKYVTRFVLAFLPLALVNCLLKFGLHQMAVLFRERLTLKLYKDYMKSYTFYQVTNLDNRISNPDQLITQDVEKFCTSVSNLYSNLSKPLLDIVIYARSLSSITGLHGPAGLLVYMVGSGVLLTGLRKPLGKLTVTEQALEGEFRFASSRLITHSEEIAFYGGNEREKENMDARFGTLTDHLREMLSFRYWVGIIDSVVAKYCATAIGYLVISPSFLDLNHPRHLNSTHSELVQDYYSSARKLMSMATAIGRLILSGRELSRLAGFTARVTQLQDVLKDLGRNKYERIMVENDSTDTSLVPHSGTVVEEAGVIAFDRVPVVTPNRDVLIKELSFEIKSGMNLLVTGANGSGKSSLFRILAGLWPLFGGKVTKSPSIFVVPQKYYLVLGSLRDQVIYPDTVADMKAKGWTDAKLTSLLKMVHLEYLVDREGGWDAVAEWTDVLSGGEKQRTAMARLFYAKPEFAILDECTSAVSVDVEGRLYSEARAQGITLVTVSQRAKALQPYHDYQLVFDGLGGYEFSQIRS